MGFDTFEDLFPQAHLTEGNQTTRINNAGYALTDFIRKYGSANSLTTLYNSLEDRLMHNRKRMLEVINENYNWIMEINKL